MIKPQKYPYAAPQCEEWAISLEGVIAGSMTTTNPFGGEEEVLP